MRRRRTDPEAFHGTGGAWAHAWLQRGAVVTHNVSRALARLRVPAVSLLLALTLLVGPGGPLAAGVGIGPDLAHAQGQGDTIRPNRYGATEGSRSVLHLPPRGTSANAPAGTPQPIAHAGAAPFPLGTLALDPEHATSFVDDRGGWRWTRRRGR